MTTPRFESLNVGDTISTLTVPPVTRQTLAVYCGASGDHNPVHVDIDFAREAGLGDVIAHGMLIMAYMGRVITDVVPQTAMRSFNTRFMAMTRVGQQIICTATVAEKTHVDNEARVRLAIVATDQYGEVKAHGEAEIVL
jgi:acyl dehydratase